MGNLWLTLPGKLPLGELGDSELNDGAPSRMQHKWPASWSEGLQKCDGNGSGALGMAESSTGQPHLNLVIQLGGMQLGSHVPIWSFEASLKNLAKLN